MNESIKKFIFLLTLFLLSFAIEAKEDWSSNRASLLYGHSFAVPFSHTTEDKTRLVISLEHASKNSWGDLYGFMDLERSTQTQANAFYGELTPRFSFYKLKGYQPDSKAILSDFLAAFTLESGVNPNGFNFSNILLGVGGSFNLPYVNYFNLNIFRRINQRSPNSWQITPGFAIPFSLGQYDFKMDGFADFVSATQTLSRHVHSQIQMKWDFGKFVLNKEKT